jgi:hypothetical protein
MTGDEHLINIDDEHYLKIAQYIIEELVQMVDEVDMTIEFMKKTGN